MISSKKHELKVKLWKQAKYHSAMMQWAFDSDPRRTWGYAVKWGRRLQCTTSLAVENTISYTKWLYIDNYFPMCYRDMNV